ncbi:hypothetical protein ACYATP_08015 [Lactobacillaceae bacterium Melli_B4]
MKNNHQFIPQKRSHLITLIVLIIELLFIMPTVIAKTAIALNGSNIGAERIWTIVALIIINLVWIITWLLTYRFAFEYFAHVLKLRNVQMAILIIGIIFTLETVIDHNYAFVAVFSIIAYLSLWTWFNYVFAHPDETNRVISATQKFFQNHKYLNRDEVQKMIKENNNELIAKLNQEHDSTDNKKDAKK